MLLGGVRYLLKSRGKLMFAAGLFVLGGVVGRMKGGWPDWLILPKIIKRLMMAGCYVLALWLAGVPFLAAVPLGILLPWWGIVMGHGSYMDFGASPGVDNEFFAPLLDQLPFMGEAEGQGNYFRDFVGMALTGIALTGPVALGLYFMGVPTFYWAVGICKALSYQTGWALQPNDGTRQSPDLVKRWLGIDGGGTIGEWLWGAVSVSLLYVFLINGW